MTQPHTVTWVDAWQLQCCGVPFAVDDEVVWPLMNALDRDFLTLVVGEELALRITTTYEAHENEDDAWPTKGRVTAIRSVTCEYAPAADQPTKLYPVHGTGRAEPKQSADGNEPEDETRKFVGYVVELRLIPS